MARYIDTDTLLKRLPDDLPYKASVRRVLMQSPTANVAPMEEVERLHTSCTELAQCCTKLETLYKIECKRVDTIKADTVREIFDLVECAFSPVLVYEGQTIKRYIAELKKKYAKGGI